MAEVSVSTWEQLVDEITTGVGVNDPKTINLIADIDLNGTQPEGVTSRIRSHNHATWTINGNGHTIRNLTFISSSPDYMFGDESTAYDYSYLLFKNIKFENLSLINQVTGNGLVRLFARVKFEDSDISLKLSGFAQACDWDRKVSFKRCGIRVDGIEGLGQGKPYFGTKENVEQCNFALYGVFSPVDLRMQSCFLDGDFDVTGFGALFDYSSNSIVIATIHQGYNDYVRFVNGANNAILRNNVKNGDVSGEYISCTEEQIKSPSYLALRGFDIIPIVVGGD